MTTSFRLAACVFIGSGLGGVARYLLSAMTDRAASAWLRNGAAVWHQFPLGTLAVNLIGCLIIGAVYGLIDRGAAMSAETRLLLTTGFCGGLTTFSTFSHENYLLFGNGCTPTLILYITLSIAGGFAAAYAGHALTH